jgi:hypothetical protein
MVEVYKMLMIDGLLEEEEQQKEGKINMETEIEIEDLKVEGVPVEFDTDLSQQQLIDDLLKEKS